MQNVLGVVGWSGSGKTVLLEYLVAQLTADGLRVNVIKHSHHDIMLEPPHKDSARLRMAANTQCPKEGPLRLTGRTSRGQRVKIVGDEEFIIRMILGWREIVPVAVELGLVSP